jgi:hypothetical protein
LLKLLQILLERPGEVVGWAALRKRPWACESIGGFDQAANSGGAYPKSYRLVSSC